MKRNYNVKNKHPMLFLLLATSIVVAPLVASATGPGVSDAPINPAVRADSVRPTDNGFASPSEMRTSDNYIEQDHNNPMEDRHNDPVTSGSSVERSYSPSYNVNDRM